MNWKNLYTRIQDHIQDIILKIIEAIEEEEEMMKTMKMIIQIGIEERDIVIRIIGIGQTQGMLVKLLIIQE